jgi:hypothetical protein
LEFGTRNGWAQEPLTSGTASPAQHNVGHRCGGGAGQRGCAFTNVLVAVVGQAFADALDAVSHVGGESLPLLHHVYQLREGASLVTICEQKKMVRARIYLSCDLLADEVGEVEAGVAENMVWQVHSRLRQRVTSGTGASIATASAHAP